MLVFKISELLLDTIDLLFVHVELFLVLPLEGLVRFIEPLAFLGQPLVLQLKLVQLALHRLYVQLKLLLNADVLPHIALQALYDLFVLLGRPLSGGHVGARRLGYVLLLVYDDVCRAHAVHGAADLWGAVAAAAAVDVVVVTPRLLVISLLLAWGMALLVQKREVVF